MAVTYPQCAPPCPRVYSPGAEDDTGIWTLGYAGCHGVSGFSTHEKDGRQGQGHHGKAQPCSNPRRFTVTDFHVRLRSVAANAERGDQRDQLSLLFAATNAAGGGTAGSRADERRTDAGQERKGTKAAIARFMTDIRRGRVRLYEWYRKKRGHRQPPRHSQVPSKEEDISDQTHEADQIRTPGRPVARQNSPRSNSAKTGKPSNRAAEAARTGIRPPASVRPDAQPTAGGTTIESNGCRRRRVP